MPERATVTARRSVPASPPVVFALLADYTRIPEVIEGLEELAPLTEQLGGVGARFQATMRLGRRAVEVELELTELEEDRLVAWGGLGGGGRSVAFELAERCSGTDVVVTVSYERPSGVAGALASPLVAETVRAKAIHALDRLSQIEGT